MINVNINLKGLFLGCFGTSDEKLDNLEVFMRTINGIKCKETKIEMILQKICNHKFDCVVLYKNDTLTKTHQLVSFYGTYDTTSIRRFDLISIPIFQNDIPTYYIHIITIIKTNKNKIPKSLLVVLENVLKNG